MNQVNCILLDVHVKRVETASRIAASKIPLEMDEIWGKYKKRDWMKGTRDFLP
jgi:hypothetical protein